MKTLGYVSSILSMEIGKCLLAIFIFHGGPPWYPFDLTTWIGQIFPPWQQIAVPAPYGLPWYLLHSPGLLGFPILEIYLAGVETCVLLLLLRWGRLRVLWLYALTSSFAFFWLVFDLWLLMLIVLSVRWRPLLLIAILVKVPLGAPAWVWSFILAGSLHTPGNWPHYVLLGVWWLGMAWHTGVLRGAVHRISLGK